MENEYGSIVTDKGTEKLVKAAKLGKKIDIKYFKAGDGNGEAYTPEKSQTELRNECYETEIISYEISDNDSKQLIIKVQIPSDAGYFVIREWGLIDSDGDLIVVGNVSDIEVVPFNTGEILNLNIEVYVQFDSTEFGGVNIVVRPTSEEFLKQDIMEEVDGKMAKIWEADGDEISDLFDFDYVPSISEFEEASDEEIRALFTERG